MPLRPPETQTPRWRPRRLESVKDNSDRLWIQHSVGSHFVPVPQSSADIAREERIEHLSEQLRASSDHDERMRIWCELKAEVNSRSRAVVLHMEHEKNIQPGRRRTQCAPAN
jgi:hypothetical protein